MSEDQNNYLDTLRQNFGLIALRLIKIYPNYILFGARANGLNAIDWENLTKELANQAGKKSEETVIAKSPTEEVEALLKEIAPYLAADGGGAGVVSADETTGKVVLALQGACSGCPSSIMTLKVGIERLLQEVLPWVKEVESDQPPVEPDFGFDLGGSSTAGEKDEGTPGSD